MPQLKSLGNSSGYETENYLRDRMDCDFVTFAVHFLRRGIVGVLVRYEVGGLYVAPVGVLAFAVEDLFVQLDVVVVDGVVESDGDHLGHVFGREVSGDGGAIFRTETVGQVAHGGVARWGAVGIVVDICNNFSVV